MVQPIDFNQPIYNAVSINIKKPEVFTKNGGNVSDTINSKDNGTFNAVKIDIDNPKVNNEPKKIYDYPEAESLVTYEMLNFNPIELPSNSKAEEIQEDVKVPAPNYTTIEAEKEDSEEKKTPDISTKLSFRGAEDVQKKPEIIPSEAILPKVDVTLVSDNLTSKDRDVQAQQMEEIVRTVLLDEETAKHYLVSDIFANLIKITEEDTTKLQPPSKDQIEARQKMIANILAVEKDKNAVNNLPYKMSDNEIMLATNLSPMELAERNKEYAITSLGALAELFIEDFESKEGRIVPITDAPGVSAIVNALRKDPDPSVKLAAIDALRHIQRPEYKEELSALFTLAQTDTHPAVAKAASYSLKEMN